MIIRKEKTMIDLILKFQYHTGTIKGNRHAFVSDKTQLFQFHTCPLKAERVLLFAKCLPISIPHWYD